MSAANLTASSRWYADATLLPAARVREFGPTLVVAAHPDDEALGCGGTVALLRQAGVPVRALILTDGAASHPGSVQYPPPVLGRLRQSESRAGLACLGVEAADVAFLGLSDGAVPAADTPDGRRTVERIRDWLLGCPGIQTILLPWRRDPHGDHRATSSLVTAALDALAWPVHRLEYPIWSMVQPAPDEVPYPGEARLWRLEIAAVAEQKRAAIMAHRSQTTGLIDDAALAECLTDDVLAIFAQPWELFIELEEAAR